MFTQQFYCYDHVVLCSFCLAPHCDRISQYCVKLVVHAVSSGMLAITTSHAHCACTQIKCKHLLSSIYALLLLLLLLILQDNGVGHIFQGAYHLASPWPARSPKKAVAAFNKALRK
jgi:hypothetical protein